MLMDRQEKELADKEQKIERKKGAWVVRTGKEMLDLFPNVISTRELDQVVIDDLCTELECDSLNDLARSFVIDSDFIDVISYTYGGSVGAAITRQLKFGLEV